MIIGLLSDVGKLRSVLPVAIMRSIEALQRVDLASMEAGRHDLEGDDLFYVLQDPVPRTIDEIRPEAHYVYTDIQIPISRRERYGFSLPETGLPTLEAPSAGVDVAFYQTPGNECFFDLDPGSFVVFFPGELHRSCLLIDDTAAFRKVVIKVHARLLGLEGA